MANTEEQLWKHIDVISKELYHSGKNYVGSIYWKQQTVAILKVLPKDKNEDKILNLASIMTMFMSKDKEPLHLKGSRDGFTCSLIHRKEDEYIFMTKRDSPYIFPEEVICKKYQIEPTPENKEKVKASIERRVYSYKHRDLKKMKRCITFENAEKLEDYLLNTLYFDIYNEDEELQKLRHLAGKKISELTPEQKAEVSIYITTTQRPVLLYKAPGDSKLLVNEPPEFKTVSYKDLCNILLSTAEECSYCKCKMTLINTQYCESGLTFDSIVSLYGHRKDNIALCCSLCNSKKTFKNKLDI
jgi:hypothetical protein